MKDLDKFEGHIVLYCKGYYNLDNVRFIEGLQRIWAVRCGLDVEFANSHLNENIADALYRIMEKLIPNKLEYLWQIIHREVAKTYLSQYEGLSCIEKLIMIYRSNIMRIRIKEKVHKNYRTLIKLPKPKRQVFKRIVLGNGEFNDYKLITNE